MLTEEAPHISSAVGRKQDGHLRRFVSGPGGTAVAPLHVFDTHVPAGRHLTSVTWATSMAHACQYISAHLRKACGFFAGTTQCQMAAWLCQSPAEEGPGDLCSDVAGQVDPQHMQSPYPAFHLGGLPGCYHCRRDALLRQQTNAA